MASAPLPAEQPSEPVAPLRVSPAPPEPIDADFDALARNAMPRMLGTARRWLGQGFAAEEAVAEALYRAFVHRQAFRGQAAFTTWVHRILCRVVADRYRALERERRHRQALQARAPRRPAPAPGRAAGVREEIERLRLGVERLPERQRLVLLLHVWEGLDLRAVAEVLGARYSTVKSTLHHARIALNRVTQTP